MPVNKMPLTFSEWYETFVRDIERYSGPVDPVAYGKEAVFERLKAKGFEFLPEKEAENEFGPVVP